MSYTKYPGILIIRHDRIGDVVLSTPLPREIKKKYPGAFIAVLLREYTKDIYVNNPYVDKIIVSDKKNNSFGDKLSLVREIRKYDFSHSIMLLPTEFNNWILFFAGIKNRIGVGNIFYQFIANTKSVSRRNYNPLRNEADYCLDLIRKIGIETENNSAEIFLTEEEKNKAKEIKKNFCTKGELLVGVHTSCGNSSPNISSNEYLELVRKLNTLKNINVVITDNIRSNEHNNVKDDSFINLNKTLRESIINFSTLDLLISSSTGPMHIAAALKVKTLSLFCPLTACSPIRWGPRGNEAHFILPGNNFCSLKCPGDPKKCNFAGDGGINSEKVFLEAKKVLEIS
jgi:heptosyltransferase-2